MREPHIFQQAIVRGTSRGKLIDDEYIREQMQLISNDITKQLDGIGIDDYPCVIFLLENLTTAMRSELPESGLTLVDQLRKMFGGTMISFPVIGGDDDGV